MQREDVLEHALTLLEQHGFAMTTLDMLAEKLGVPVAELTPFWPDREALLYDSLRHHSQQVDTWRRQLLLDDEKSIEQKLLARYQVLHESVNKQRYPGCLFIAACSFFLISITLSTRSQNNRNWLPTATLAIYWKS